MKFLFYAIIACSNIVSSTHAMMEGDSKNLPIKSAIYKADTTIENNTISSAKIIMGACSLFTLARLSSPFLAKRTALSLNVSLRHWCPCQWSAAIHSRPTMSKGFFLASPAVLAIGTGCHDFYTQSVESQRKQMLEKTSPSN